MMFLQYFIWGAWYVTMGTYMRDHLSSTGDQIGSAYMSLAIATMISPFFIGMVADRFFAAQKLMGILHIFGGILLFLATRITDNDSFYWVILLYSLMYTPTIALSNSVAFYQMSDAGKQFPWIRVFGTIGWIAAGISIDQLGIGSGNGTFTMASMASIFLGIYSFVLPNTPPQYDKEASLSKSIGLEGLVLLKDKAYLVFFIVAILICIPLSFYYGFANTFLTEVGLENATSKMTIGQVSEAVFIVAIPFLFHTIGVKKMLVLGIGAWVLRYVCFAYGNTTDFIWMLYAGIILHGICYDFFFVTGYMYTEQKAGEKIKNAAQGLFTFATYGLGMVIGTKLSGITVDAYTTKTLDGAGNITNSIIHWDSVWFIPAGIGLVVLMGFMIFFQEKKK